MDSKKTTLTREALLKKARLRYEEVEVEGFGMVGLRQPSEVKRMSRAARMYDEGGNTNPANFAKRRIHAIIDQVMIDENTPMFSESDAEALGELSSFELDSLYMAIQNFNLEIDPKKKEESAASG